MVLVPLAEPIFLGESTEGSTSPLTFQQIMIIVGVVLAVAVLVVITVVVVKFWHARELKVTPNENPHDNAAYA